MYSIFGRLPWPVLLIGFCTAATAQDPDLPVPYAQLAEEDLVYNATFNFKDEQVSGLLAIKSQSDGYQVVMISKFGLTIADFILGADIVTWNKPFPGKERKTMLRAIEKDFRLLLLTPLHRPEKIKAKGGGRYTVKKSDKIEVSLSDDGRTVARAKTKGFPDLNKSHATYHYREAGPVPHSMTLTHDLIKLSMELIRTEI